jgi:hypothetical protein
LLVIDVELRLDDLEIGDELSLQQREPFDARGQQPDLRHRRIGCASWTRIESSRSSENPKG